jgi:glutathione synthase/RimK-type ligase-like ATP-grasp enzyme
MRHADIALVSERRYVNRDPAPDDWYLQNILHDDRLLAEALAAHGLTTQRVDWSDATVDWGKYRVAVFRTTWDYFERFAEFTAWLARAARDVRFLNDARTVWWNLDKHYLGDLERRGVAIVPSLYHEAGSAETLPELLRRSGWPEGVLKPCVSGAARHTYRVNEANAAALQETLAPVLAAEAFLYQPFVRDIQVGGERSLMVLGGVATHAVQKVPKAGDFRVQDDHGGSWSPYVPTPEEIAFAQQAIAAVEPRPAYGRVDFVRGNDGALQLMELELIEPELWLRSSPEAAARFAAAIAAAVG